MRKTPYHNVIKAPCLVKAQACLLACFERLLDMKRGSASCSFSHGTFQQQGRATLPIAWHVR